jgi:oligopeptide transport system substrate-binding protein
MLLSVTMLFSACSSAPAAEGSEPAAEAPAAEATEAAEAAEAEGEAPAEAEGETTESPLQVKALDDKTLEVKLIANTPYFLELTAFPTYMPVQQAVVESAGEAWATEASTYIGNGPYMVTDWVPSSHITMEKNPHYWEQDLLGPQSIKFNLIEGAVPQLNGFQNGSLKFVDDAPPEEIAALKSTPTFHSQAQMGTYYVSLNNQVAPFDDPLVRQAFILAIDRVHMADVIGSGLYIPAGAWVPPGLSDATPGSDFRETRGDYYDPTAYEANLAEAKALLEQAGYPGGEGLPVIEYLYNEGSVHQPVAEALQNMWGELGANVELVMQEWNTLLETRKNGEYMTTRDGWLNDYNDPIGMLDLFITGGGNNNSQYINPEYDALITSIKTSSDPAARFDMMHQAEDMLMNDWVFAPIMYYGDPYLQDTTLDGSVWSSPLGYKYFMYAENYDDAELNVCVGPNPATIDPALNSAVDGATMIIHAFEGLYRLNRDGTPEPAMAESVDISEDGLTYTFHLRDGIAWSDGSPITANDFVYSWTRAIDPMTAADYGYMFESIEGYTAAIGG